MRNLIYLFQKEKSSLYFIVTRMVKIFLILSILVLITCCSRDSAIEPRLNTLKAVDTDITSATALLKGEVTYLGNMKIIEYGIELSKNQTLIPSQTKGIAGLPDLGQFEVEFTGLEPNTVYYYKAYALINTAYVYSQNREHFTTKQ
jgi:hypothetical protein